MGQKSLPLQIPVAYIPRGWEATSWMVPLTEMMPAPGSTWWHFFLQSDRGQTNNI